MLNELRWHVQTSNRSVSAFFEANTEARHVKVQQQVTEAADGLRNSLG